MTEAAAPAAGSGAGARAKFFIVGTVAIDAMGIGLILPVMPDLLEELSGLDTGQAALWGGYLAFVYAAMQLLFSPLIGGLSDAYGRRPVLLLSLFALTLDYLVMGFAWSLWVLFLTRIVAGIAGATFSTAMAYLADVSKPEERAANFGLVGAGFGVGFVFGPVIGGLVGDMDPRAPFFAAAVLAAANMAFGLYVLPESLSPARRRAFSLRRANPAGAVMQIARMPRLKWLFTADFLYEIAHFVYPAIWAFYAKEMFGWSPWEIGLSLAAVGIGFAIAQGWMIRIILARLGEEKTALWGIFINVISLIGFAFAQEGWHIYAIIPLTALGAVFSPAIKALMANRTEENAQGELQGAIASIGGLTAIVSPLAMTAIFTVFTLRDGPAPYFPGAPFLAAAGLMALATIPFLIGVRRR